MTLLNLELLEKSPIKGDIVDLTTPIMDGNSIYRVYDGNKKYAIGSEMLAKPSAIAQYVYGDSNKLDYVAYHNGFSNPFAIPPNYVIEVPELAVIKSVIASGGQNSEGNIARDFFNKKESVVDQKRKMMLTGDAERPNMSKIQDRNTIVGDRIILGTNSVEFEKSIGIGFMDKGKTDKDTDGFIDYFEEYLEDIKK